MQNTFFAVPLPALVLSVLFKRYSHRCVGKTDGLLVVFLELYIDTPMNLLKCTQVLIPQMSTVL